MGVSTSASPATSVRRATCFLEAPLVTTLPPPDSDASRADTRA